MVYGKRIMEKINLKVQNITTNEFNSTEIKELEKIQANLKGSSYRF